MAGRLPVTPSRNRAGPGYDGLSAVIQGLNDEYNLGIGEPDPTWTPRHTPQLPPDVQRNLSIRHGIRYLFFRDRPNLEKTLDRFREQVRAIWPTRTEEPRPDCNLPSPSRGLLKAATDSEQHELQVILLDLLRQATPSETVPAQWDQTNAGRTTSSKRRPGDRLENLPAKRTKPEVVPPRSMNGDDRSEEIPLRLASFSGRILFPHTSATTSSTSLSSVVFSSAPQDEDCYSETIIKKTGWEDGGRSQILFRRSGAVSESSYQQHGLYGCLSWKGSPPSPSHAISYVGSSKHPILPKSGDLLVQDAMRRRQEEIKAYEADYQPKILGKQLADIWRKRASPHSTNQVRHTLPSRC